MTHQGRRADRIKWTTNSMAASRDLIRDFLGSVPAKCENCGCCAPKITPEGANKIYRASLTGKQREANAALDIDLDGELADLAAPGEDAQEVAPDPANDKKKKRRKKKDAGSDSEDGGSDSEDDSDSGSGSDSGSDSDEEGEATKKKTRVDTAAAMSSRKQVFITPIEARALLKKLWSREYDFCSMTWAAAPPTYGMTQGAKDPIVNRSDPARFFMQTVLVTPCRLRPPARMGDMMFEHPQNTHLNAIIQANLTLAELFRKPETVPEPPEVRAQRAESAGRENSPSSRPKIWPSSGGGTVG